MQCCKLISISGCPLTENLLLKLSTGSRKDSKTITVSHACGARGTTETIIFDQIKIFLLEIKKDGQHVVKFAAAIG